MHSKAIHGMCDRSNYVSISICIFSTNNLSYWHFSVMSSSVYWLNNFRKLFQLNVISFHPKQDTVKFNFTVLESIEGHMLTNVRIRMVVFWGHWSLFFSPYELYKLYCDRVIKLWPLHEFCMFTMIIYSKNIYFKYINAIESCSLTFSPESNFLSGH